MQSLLVFPALDRGEALRRLQSVGVRTDLPIAVSEPDRRVLMWAALVEDLAAADVTDDDLDDVERLAGFRPEWGIEIAISGHFPDWRQRDLRTLMLWLLSAGGCATSIEVDEFRTAEQWQGTWAG